MKVDGHTKIRETMIIWLGVLVLIVLPFEGKAAVVSVFDADAEGWTAAADYQSYHWVSDVGNPPGSFWVEDLVTGDTWYFFAPNKFLGDKSAAYGQTLSWDINISTRDSSDWGAPHVILGSGDNTISWYDTRIPIPNQWENYTITLTELGGWKKSDDSTPTQAEMLSILGNLTVLKIRGEYRTGYDEAYLDNVVLIPEPCTLLLLLVGSLALLRRHRA